jgi:hypothetical protein
VPRCAQGGVPPGPRQPAQGEEAHAAQVVHQEGRRVEAHVHGHVPAAAVVSHGTPVGHGGSDVQGPGQVCLAFAR